MERAVVTLPSSRLVFHGQVLDGFDAATVKQRLGEQLKLDAARLDHLFSGQRVVIKREIEREQGLRHVQQFARLGARLLIEDLASAVASGPAPAPIPAPAPPPPPAPLPATTEQPANPTVAALLSKADGLSLVPMAGEMAGGGTAAEATITCPTCGEVQPQAVFCRSCVTNMPMGIAARAETQAAAKPPAEAPARTAARASTRARTAPEEPEAGAPSARLLGMGFKGRLARAPYVAASVVSVLVGSLIVLWALHKPGMGRLTLVGVVWLALLLYGLRLSVLRCHDCNRSGWWSLLLAVPVVGWLATLALALMRGTEGNNRFGEPPDEGNQRLYTIVSTCAALALALVVRPALSDLDTEPTASAFGRQAAPAAAATFDSEAARVYATEYTMAPNHKAFAVSGKAYGWRTGMATAQEAAEQALANCEEHRAAHTEACELISVDGSGYGPEGR